MLTAVFLATTLSALALAGPVCPTGPDYYTGAIHPYKCPYEKSELCLDVMSFKVNGAVQVAKCNGKDRQRFKFVRAADAGPELIYAGADNSGWCLTIPRKYINKPTPPLTKLLIDKCSDVKLFGGTNRKWVARKAVDNKQEHWLFSNGDGYMENGDHTAGNRPQIFKSGDDNPGVWWVTDQDKGWTNLGSEKCW